MTSQHDKPKRWQFGLRSLFALTTGVSVGLAIWPLLAVGVLTLAAVLAGLAFCVVYYWQLFAIAAITGVVVTRSVVMIGKWLDSREQR